MSLYRRTALAGLTALLLSSCASTSAVNIVGAAMNAALETAGLKKAQSPGGGPPPREVKVSLHAGRVMNTTNSGQPLALLVRLYHLRSPVAFDQLSYETMLDKERQHEALGRDLVSVRELTLIPGETLDLNETMPADALVLGIAAMYRAPARGRWKYAFDAAASERNGISLGLHACAISLGKGVLSNTDAAEPAKSLASVKCPGQDGTFN